MNYNYPQPQYTGYNNYRPNQWSQMTTSVAQVRPVSSIEEVRACPIDFDGSVFYFADVANKRIYTKQVNLDGTVSIYLYEQRDLPSVNTDQFANNVSYVTKEEFDEVVEKIRMAYEQLATMTTAKVETI